MTEHQTRIVKAIIAAVIVGLITVCIDLYYETHHVGRG